MKRKQPKYRPSPVRAPKYGEWHDVSSYSQGETDRTPRAFDMKTPLLRISVYFDRRAGMEGWYVSCHDVRVQSVKLEAEDVTGAQIEGLEYVRATIKKMLAGLPE